MTLETRPSSGDGLFLQSCASDVMAHVSYRLPDTAKVYFDAPRMASVASINSSHWCLFAWARPPTVLLTQLADDANADFFFFSPSFFAVITVILHGWRCTSTGSTLTADPFLFYFFKKKASIFFFIRMGMILLMSEVHFSQVRLKFTAWDWPSSTKTRGDEAVSG